MFIVTEKKREEIAKKKKLGGEASVSLWIPLTKNRGCGFVVYLLHT